MPKYSVNTSHQTPPELFEVLNREFHFTLDPCATKETALCEKYFTPREDGLSQSWAGHSVFMNPPYDRYINKWVSKAYTEARDHHATVVCLLPASTDTKWFHHYALSGEIRFLVGRLKFSGLGRAKFASVLVIYRPQALKITIKTVQVTGYDCHHCPVWAATRNAAQAPEGAQCTNCVNEAHKAKSQRSNATMTPITDETLYGTPDVPQRPGLDQCPVKDDGHCPTVCPHWAQCSILMAQEPMDLSLIAGD